MLTKSHLQILIEGMRLLIMLFLIKSKAKFLNKKDLKRLGLRNKDKMKNMYIFKKDLQKDLMSSLSLKIAGILKRIYSFIAITYPKSFNYLSCAE
jgi:hypothetical protein